MSIVTMPIYGQEALVICHNYMTDILQYMYTARYLSCSVVYPFHSFTSHAMGWVGYNKINTSDLVVKYNVSGHVCCRLIIQTIIIIRNII